MSQYTHGQLRISVALQKRGNDNAVLRAKVPEALVQVTMTKKRGNGLLTVYKGKLTELLIKRTRPNTPIEVDQSLSFQIVGMLVAIPGGREQEYGFERIAIS